MCVEGGVAEVQVLVAMGLKGVELVQLNVHRLHRVHFELRARNLLQMLQSSDFKGIKFREGVIDIDGSKGDFLMKVLLLDSLDQMAGQEECQNKNLLDLFKVGSQNFQNVHQNFQSPSNQAVRDKDYDLLSSVRNNIDEHFVSLGHSKYRDDISFYDLDFLSFFHANEL